MFNYFFMNEECAMQMRAIHKKERTWRPLLILDCTDTAAIYLLPHPLITRVFWGGGEEGETLLGISQAILC